MAAKMATYGHIISDTQIVLVILVNVNNTAAHEYGREFRNSMTAIRKLFGPEHVHTAASLKTTTKELCAANGVRDMRKAPSPSNLLGAANAADDVDNRVAKMQRMMQGIANSVGSSEYESAYGTAASFSHSELSGETRQRQERKERKRKKEEKGLRIKEKEKEKKSRRKRPEYKGPGVKRAP